MKFNILLSILLFSFTLSGLSTYAQSQHLILGSSEANQSPAFGDLVRNADGSIQKMSQADALKYCNGQGMHLPNVREFAQLAQSLGAKGISEKAEVGYRRIIAHEADGTVDEFYYNSDGYQRPLGDLGRDLFYWTTSNESFGTDFTFFFMGFGGEFSNYHNNWEFAVRCVTNP